MTISERGVAYPDRITLSRKMAHALGIVHGSTSYAVWVRERFPTADELANEAERESGSFGGVANPFNAEPVGIPRTLGRVDQASHANQALHLIVSPLPLFNWITPFRIEATLKYSPDVLPDGNDPTSIPLASVMTTLAQFHNFSIGIGSCVLASAAVVNAGFKGRRLTALGFFDHFPEELQQKVLNYFPSDIAARRKGKDELFRSIGKIMLPALSELKSVLLDKCKSSFVDRIVDQSDPFLLAKNNIDSTFSIDETIWQDARTLPLRLRPLPHLTEFLLRACTHADFHGSEQPIKPGAKKSKNTRTDSHDSTSAQSPGTLRNMNYAFASREFVYDGREQALKLRTCGTSLLSELDMCVKKEALGHAEPAENLDSFQYRGSATSLCSAFPLDGYLRFRFFRTGLVQKRLFPVRLQYRIAAGSSRGLFASICEQFRRHGFTFQFVRHNSHQMLHRNDNWIEVGSFDVLLYVHQSSPLISQLDGIPDCHAILYGVTPVIEAIRALYNKNNDVFGMYAEELPG